MEITIDLALQKGIEAHKGGQVQEADQYYTAILKAYPNHPDANHNMGALAVGLGKFEEALPFFKTALEANSSVSQFWLSYINALIKLNRLDDAKAVFDEAISNGADGELLDQIEKQIGSATSKKSIAQEPSQEQLQSLINLYTQGQYQETLTQASLLLKGFPNSIHLYNIIGSANQSLCKLEEAIEDFKKALSIKPNYAEGHYNMGNALQEQGKLENAIGAYKKAISIKPDYAEAYNNMGNALKKQGMLEDAINAYIKALSLKADYAEAYNNTGLALKGIVFNKPNRRIQKAIISLLNRERYIRPKDIAKAAISLLKLEPGLQKYLKMVDAEVVDNLLDIILDLSEFPLLLKLMSVCPLPDLELEKLLKKLRCALLSNISSLKEVSPELIRFQSALALQCFTNEYIYSHTEEEEKILQSLDASVKKAFNNNKKPSPQVILALASYKALNEYNWCKLLVVNNEIKEVFTRQVEEPNHEEKLKQDLPVLEEVTDSISSEVRAQYEESPYPRWVNLGVHLRPFSILNVIDQIKLKLHDNKIIEVENPEILIAGCGTGQHSIGTATRFKGSKVLAIDLSLSSLAYAKRKTDELGIENIEYMQADILDLGHRNKLFDIIESIGVLHHMDNPLAGWKVLTDCLKPGGLMKIGLYSELARQHIVRIKDEISQHDIRANEAEMRSFRDMIMKTDQNHHKRILNSLDFYSLSTLKDLLFNVKEHRFTIPKIKGHLDELGLKFCGFETEKIVLSFKETNTHLNDLYDLNKWHAYELLHPGTFAGMYQFWCQKFS